MNEREIFAAALEQPTEAERQTFLDQVCDEETRPRIERLLKERASLGSFMEHPPLEATDAEAPEDATIVYSTNSTNDGKLKSKSERLAEMTPLDYLKPSSMPGSLGRLGHYEVLEVIGRGAFGIVLRAHDEKLQRVIAIKVMTPELAATSPARKRFKREATASASVRHENVVAIHAVEDDPIPYLVMEFIPGKTLQERLEDEGPLELPDVLRVGKQIADGLAAAHAQGLIHRDIKPGNILLEGGMQDRVKITDFGLAHTADDANITQSGVIAGTPMYMAPEQAHGRKLDHRVDLFSFGTVLYQMLSGRPPFRAPSTLAVLKRVTEDTPRPIQEIIPEVPEWMCELVGHLHAKDPNDRFDSAQQVSELLSKCADDLRNGREPLIPNPAGRTTNEANDDGKVEKSANRSPVLNSLARVAAVILLVLGILGVSEATNLTNFSGTVIRLALGSGTLVIETDDPRVKVAIDGEEVKITGVGVEEIKLRPGDYQVAAIKDGKPVSQQLVTITRGGRQVIKITLEGKDANAGRDPIAKASTDTVESSPASQHATPSPPGPFTDADVNRVSRLPIKERIAEVRREIQLRNPGFDSHFVPTEADGVVTHLTLDGEHVSDISPIRAFTELKSLNCRAPRPGKLSDLSPLRGLPLIHLNATYCPIDDLSPLEGMKLTRLFIAATNVSDLTPVSGMPLEALFCAGSRVSDLTPLRGMPLTQLQLEGTPLSDLTPIQGLSLLNELAIGRRVTDLSPLKGLQLKSLTCAGATELTDLTPLEGMPLTYLNLDSTKVSDITPLQGMPLKALNLSSTRVKELSPLKDMKIKTLHLAGSLVTDLSPLQSFPLRELFAEIKPSRDAEILRSITTLRTINGRSAKDYWMPNTEP